MKRLLSILLAMALLITGCGEEKKVTTIEFEELPADSYQERAIALSNGLGRIREVLNEAAEGESLTIGFIGGSITEGYGVNDRSKSYMRLVSDWFTESFPNAEFTFINAGVAGTGSDYACERLDEDLLKYEPDFVFVEFSVNDETSFARKK